MPYGIGRRQIAKTRIANTPIATVGRVRAEQEPYVFPGGSYSFSPPYSGRWKFVAWGAGGEGSASTGGSGSYGEVTRYLTPTDVVTLVVARGSLDSNTSITFPNGDVCTAGNADTASAAGSASGSWDYSLNGTAGTTDNGSTNGNPGSGTGGGAGGTAGGVNGGGAGAPGRLPYRGGRGGDGTGSTSGAAPGGGAGGVGSGASGLILVLLERASS